MNKFNEYKLEKIFFNSFLQRFFEKYEVVERATLNWNQLFAKNETNDMEFSDDLYQEAYLGNSNKPSSLDKIKIQIENIIKYVYHESVKCKLNFISDSLIKFCIQNRIILLEEKNKRIDKNKLKNNIYKENENMNIYIEDNLHLSENIEPAETDDILVNDEHIDDFADDNDEDSENLSQIIDGIYNNFDTSKDSKQRNLKRSKIKNNIKITNIKSNKSTNKIHEDPIFIRNKRNRSTRIEKEDENNTSNIDLKKNSRELSITKNSENKNRKKVSINKRLSFDEGNNEIHINKKKSSKKPENTNKKKICKSPCKLKISKEQEIKLIKKSGYKNKKLEVNSKKEEIKLKISPKKSRLNKNRFDRTARKIEKNELSYQNPQKLSSNLRKNDIFHDVDYVSNKITQRNSPRKLDSVVSQSSKVVKFNESPKKKSQRLISNTSFERIQDSIRLKKSKSITSSRSSSRSPSITPRERSNEASPFSNRNSSRFEKNNLDLTKIKDKLKNLKNETPTKKNNQTIDHQIHNNRELKSLEIQNISLNTPRQRTPEKFKSPLKNNLLSDKKIFELKTPSKKNSGNKKERNERIKFEFDPKTPVRSLSFNIKISPRMKNNLINKKSNLKKPINVIEKNENKTTRSASKINSPLNSNKKRKFS